MFVDSGPCSNPGDSFERKRIFLGVSRELRKRRCAMIPVDGCVDDGAWRGWGTRRLSFRTRRTGRLIDAFLRTQLCSMSQSSTVIDRFIVLVV